MSAPPSGSPRVLTLRDEDIVALPTRTRSATELVLPRRGDDPAIDPRWRTQRR